MTSVVLSEMSSKKSTVDTIEKKEENEVFNFKGKCVSYSDNIYPTCIAESSNGVLAIGDEDGVIKIIKDGKCIDILKGHTDAITCIIILPNGDIVSGSNDTTIIVWRNGKSHIRLHNYSRVSCLVSFPDGKFASGGNDGDIRIWIGETLINTLGYHNGRIKVLKLVSGNCLLAIDAYGTMTMWK